jgi:hypothetical protein
VESFKTARATYQHCLKKQKQRIRFQDGRKREEAESVSPKVKSWRDAGDTPYRKKHQKPLLTPPACT